MCTSLGFEHNEDTSARITNLSTLWNTAVTPGTRRHLWMIGVNSKPEVKPRRKRTKIVRRDVPLIISVHPRVSTRTQRGRTPFKTPKYSLSIYPFTWLRLPTKFQYLPYAIREQ